MKKIGKSSLTVGLSAAFVASATIPSAVAESNPFAATPLASGYEVVNQVQHQPVESKDFKEGKCGEGKCGGSSSIDADKAERKGKICDGSKKAAKEGKCGEGKCGEGKCGGKAETKQFTEGTFAKEKTKGKICDGSKKAAKEGKCGEGKCGEGKCGGKQ